MVQGAAAATMVASTSSRCGSRSRATGRATARIGLAQPSFTQSWALFAAQGQPVRRLVAVGLGTMAFSMQDVLLEPYGGQVLHLSVGATTGLTAILALGGLAGFVIGGALARAGRRSLSLRRDRRRRRHRRLHRRGLRAPLGIRPRCSPSASR